MKKILFSLFLAMASRLFAVAPVPYTEGVSFSFRISGYGGGIMTVYEESSTAPDINYTTLGTTSESHVKTAWLRPGKKYEVNFQSSGTTEYWLSFIAPAGFEVKINDQVRNVVYDNPGGGWYSHNYTIELRPIAGSSSPALFGEFSGIAIGKAISWEIGLGSLSNGRNAGRLLFREENLTSSHNPASRDRLYLGMSESYGEIWTFKDGPSNQRLRQVASPQGLIDILDDPAGGYWLKYYTHSQLEGSPGNPFIIYGSPWKTIRVESPSAAHLKISETEGSVSRVSYLSLESGSVASGNYKWKLQEGTSGSWLKTTTNVSTRNADTSRDDIATVYTGSVETPSAIASQTKYHYEIPGAFTTGEVNTMTYNSASIPLTLAPGASVSFLANVTNTGTNTWGSNHYLALRDASGTWLGGVSTSGLAPQASGNYTINITAPSAPGFYTYYLRGLEHMVKWFDNMITVYLTVEPTGSTGVTNRTRVNTASIPKSVTPGAKINFTANTTNVGTNAWTSNHQLVLRDPSWTWLDNESVSGVAALGSTNSTMSFSAPTTPGEYMYLLHGLNLPSTWMDKQSPVMLTVTGAGWGEELTQVIADPSGAALTTTYAYYANPNDRGHYRRLKSITEPTGYWTAWQYYDDWNKRGQVKSVFNPHLDAPASVTFNPALGRVSYFEYSADWTGRHTRPSLNQIFMNNVRTAQTIWSHGDSSGGGWPREQTYTMSYSDGLNYRTDYSERYRADAGHDEPGLPYMAAGADSTKTVWNRGNTGGGGAQFREIVIRGSSNGTGASAVSSWDTHTFESIYVLPGKSTLEATIRNSAGLVTRSEKWVYTGSGGTNGFSLSTYEDFTYDFAGRLTARTAANGLTATNTYMNGRLMSSKGVDGTVTEFTYDALGRVATSKKKGVSPAGYTTPGDISTTYTYDGAGRVTQTQVVGGALTQTSSSVYDKAGRITQSTAPGSYSTDYAYNVAAKTVTTTLPGTGAQQITTSYLDGRPKSLTGNAEVAQYTDFTVNGGTGNITRKTTLGTPTSTAWVKSSSDWLGRALTEVKPGWNGSDVTRSWFYNSAGQLVKLSQPGMANTLYSYDTIGGLTREGLDINGNGTLDLAGSDRIVDYAWTLVNSGGWWKRDTTYTYATAGSGTGTPTKRVEQQFGGFPTNRLSMSKSFDIYGNVTIQSVDVDSVNKKITTTVDLPNSSTDAVQIAYSGMVVSSKDAAGVTVKYGYDALGRPSTVIDPRTGTTTTAYKSGTNQIHSVTDGASIVQATYTYDSAGRVATMTNGATKVSRYAYTDRNEPYRTWGDTEYPVEYAYDNCGRQVTMKTFRGGSGWTGVTWPASPGTADTTTWNYQESTGLLSSKTDSAGRSVNFTYTQPGKVATRTLSRGTVTTYAYSSTTGELTGTTYSDSTPANGFTYNRLGQMATATDITGTSTMTYNLTGTLELQHQALGSYYGSQRLTYGYDTTTTGALGRATSFALGTAVNPSASQAQSYSYQADGRLLNTSANAASYSSSTFAYGYVANSNLIASVSHTASGYSDTRVYDPYHNWVDSRTTKISTTTKAAFAYTQDNLGRVTQTGKTGEVFNRYGNGTEGLTTYSGYDDRSQVISDVTKVGITATVLTGRNDTYAYDPIGNRTGTTHNGNSAAYTANNLNQYTSRTVPGYFDVAGSAPGSVVTVTKSGGSTLTASRHGPYFFSPYPLTNTSVPVSTTLNVADNTTPTPHTATVSAYLAKTPEPFGYDLDGNLTSDGRWIYTYDAENRLITAETLAAAVTAGVPRQKLTFAYDYMGRRVSKIVQSGWTGSAYATTTTSRRFIYNGWNLVAELDQLASGAVVSSHFWGFDLSGSSQGAGGISGLLMSQNGGSTYLPAYDAMGNVHAMIKASDGSIAAAYEYDAFGKTVRESGTYAAANPFRYSTKYTDIETGLVYYGYRYYDPSTGRFINRDPIEESGGLNLYGFVGNNGLNRWDYLGQWAFSARGMLWPATHGGSEGINPLASSGGGQQGMPSGAPVVFVDEMDVAMAGTGGNAGSWVQGAINNHAKATMRDELLANSGGTITASQASALASSIVEKGWQATWEANGGTGNINDAARTNNAPNSAGIDPGGKGDIGTYLVRKNAAGEWVIVGKTNGVTTPNAYVNGILGTLGRHAELGGKHMPAGVTEFTLFNNPSKGFFADVWETSMDKLGFTSVPAKALAGVLQGVQSSGSNVSWVAHSQGGAIFAEAMSYAGGSLSHNSVTFNAGANNHWVTNSIAASAGVQVNGYYYSSWDAVPNVIGANGNPLSMLGSVLAAPLLFTDNHSPHTAPTSGWRKRF